MADYFGQGYLNAMDRFGDKLDIGPISGSTQQKAEPLLNIREIGVSIMATRDAIQPLVAKIREGASKVEIGFMGAGKGSIFSGQITPESVDAEQRRAIREIAKINKVELSTHASVGTGGFAGFTNRGFDDTTREQNVQELKRAIDFAADTAQGGAITVHMDEFIRPISEVERAESPIKFLSHPDEKKTTTYYLVNEQTGDIIKSVSKDVPVHVPVWRHAKKGENADEFGNALDPFGNRIPELDPKNKNKFQLQTLEWDNKKAPNDILRETEARNKIRAEKGEPLLKPEQVYYELQVESKRYQLEGERLFHMQDYNTVKKNIAKNQERAALLKEMEKIKDPNQRLSMAANAGWDVDDPQERKLLMNSPGKLAEGIQNALDREQHHLSRINSAAISYQEQLEEFQQSMKKIKPMEQVAVAKSVDALGRAGLYAYDVEQAKGLNKDGKKPLFIAPENLFAEKYGSHPDELKTLILGSRKDMAKRLVARGMPEEKARDIANDHIKATLDIGHLNTWRKYFQGKEGESLADQGKRFNEWMIDKIKELNKDRIIGHVHITDNFGYHDEHLTPGEGSAPILEFVKVMRDQFEKEGRPMDLVVEPGAQDPAKQYEALYGGWKLFGHSIYGLSAPGKKTLDFGQTQHNYFGHTTPPQFLFGELALSDEYRGSPFFTGLGLE